MQQSPFTLWLGWRGGASLSDTGSSFSRWQVSLKSWIWFIQNTWSASWAAASLAALAVKGFLLMQPHQYTNRDTRRRELWSDISNLSHGIRFPLCTHAAARRFWGVKWSYGLSLHQPKDCKWYFLFFLPRPLLQRSLCWFDAMYMNQYYITWLSAWMTALSNTHFALRNVRYQVPIVRERQLRWCHSYFMLLLLKKNRPLTQTPRQSTFKLLTVKSCSCMRISYTLYLTLQSLFWMTTINFLPQDWPFKYLPSF